MSGVSAPKENPAAFHGDYDTAPKFKTAGLKNMGNMGMDLFALNYARCIFAGDLYVNKKETCAAPPSRA
jgi:hypothetical protein